MGLEDQIAVTLIDNDLPEGWALPRISDLIEINYGKGLKDSDRKVGPVPVYGSNGVVGSHNASLSKGPAIIVGRKGSVGAIHYSPTACWPIDTTYYIDEFNGLNPQFLMYALRTLNLADLDTSTAIPGLNRNDVYMQEVPLPPLGEQNRIVAKVEELLARVNTTKERLAKVSMILKRFRQAVLATACSGRLTADWRDNATRVTQVDQTIHEILQQREEEWIKANTPKKYKQPQDVRIDGLQALPEGWKYISFDTLISFVTSGSRGWAKYYAESGPIFIRVGNLDHDTISPNFTGVQHVNPPAGQEGNRTRTQLGDILISITADVGMIALLRNEIGEAYVNQHVSIARPVKNTFRPYLAWYLASREGGQAQFQDLQRGATKVGLGLDDIRSITIPFPPIEEQQEIVRRVEAMFKLADDVEKRVEAAKVRAEKLTHAILAKAFRGELVSTEAELARREGRSYESASELLARIKSNRELKQASQKVRRNRG